MTGRGQEGQLQEGLLQCRAQRESSVAQVMQGVADALVGFQAHQAGDRQRDLAGDPAVLDDDEAPLISLRRWTACAMSSSLTPTTQMLWLSWPTVEAIAPFFSPKPWTKALA